MFGIIKGLNVVVLSLSVAAIVAGCNVEGRGARSQWPTGAETSEAPAQLVRSAEGIDIAITDAREIDLVEALVDCRKQYHDTLRRLHDYYSAHGYTTKQGWAQLELQGLRGVKASYYLLDAEIASEALRPAEQISEADALFDQARELMRRGGHNVPGIYRRDRMIEAAGVFRELIQKYPSSDKIDESAFFLGEIHKEYMPGQEIIAARWYERAYTWNPQTPQPARFQAAVVYDYRLHDRDRALELYQAATQYETSHSSNLRFALRRIEELTSGSQSPRSDNP
jgi:hypothetical protein